jgi:acetylornithine deacetylase/succinyl-diaminopimelate desuccinylase-like protein
LTVTDTVLHVDRNASLAVLVAVVPVAIAGHRDVRVDGGGPHWSFSVSEPLDLSLRGGLAFVRGYARTAGMAYDASSNDGRDG